MTFNPNTIAQVLGQVIPKGAALHEPEIGLAEKACMAECLDSGWVSTAGAFVGRFEESLAAYTGAKHAIACVNGTSALHTCLLLAGVQPTDEVIIPTLTFVATANAVSYCSATPHFADSDRGTLGLDVGKLANYLSDISHITQGNCYNRRTGLRISAVVCVHTFGHAVDLDPLLKVCKNYKLPLIEDAAESLGSFYKERHTGLDGVMSALSFNGNKIVTAGGGGAILTGDDDLAAKARHLTTTAKTSHPWQLTHDRVGYNYRMPNINAALGLGQMERLENFLERKRRLAMRYQEAFANVDGVEFFQEPAERRSNYWLNVLLLDQQNASLRDSVLQTTNDAGFMVRPAWTPMHRLEMFKECPKMNLDTAEDIGARLINIPSGVGLMS